MTATDARLISEARAQIARTEARALQLRIELGVLRHQCNELDKAEMKRRHRDAQEAVALLVQGGKIRRNDLLSQMEFHNKFAADPFLIELALPQPMKGRYDRNRI